MATIVETTSRLSSSLHRPKEDVIPLAPVGSHAGSVTVPHDLGIQASLTGNHVSETQKTYSRFHQVSVILMLSGISFATSASGGLVVIGLPAITKATNLPAELAFWPSSVTSLATASALLLAGAISDVTSPRVVELVGCLLTGGFMLACGAVQTGEQMVAMRALQGLGMACHCAASVALITAAVPAGKGRNMAFATWGLSQPFGFSFGLVVGGVMVETLGWRSGFFLWGGMTMALFFLGIWALPKGVSGVTRSQMGRQLKKQVDWVGAGLASAAMTLMSYLLATLSTDVYRIKDGESIAFLCLSVAGFAGFILWMHFQVKWNRPALIPNELWKNSTFSSMCAVITLSLAVVTCLELFASLFFQEIQKLSELQAAIRILPSLIVGIALNLTMGFFVNKVSAVVIVIVSSLLAAISPLLMAVIDPSTTYWANAFVAQILQPVSCDCLFTVGLIVVTEIFPKDKHSLAGAVFNTMYQFGTALGLAVVQIVSTLVTQKYEHLPREAALMKGYRASFWTMFAFMLSCAVIGGWGLRKTGKVGLKKE